MRFLPYGIALALAAYTETVDAHPVHEVVQNAYLTLSPGSLELQLELTAGPKVAAKVMSSLDTNADRRITPTEAQAFASRVLLSSVVAIDRPPLRLRLMSVDTPSYAALMGAHGTIKIIARASRSDQFGPATLSYRNSYKPAESRCDANVFLKPSSRLRYQITSQVRGRDGRNLVVRFTAARVE